MSRFVHYDNQEHTLLEQLQKLDMFLSDTNPGGTDTVWQRDDGVFFRGNVSLEGTGTTGAEVTTDGVTVIGNFPTYTGTTGIEIEDSGLNINDFVTTDGATVIGNFARYTDVTGNTIESSGVSINDIVSTIPTPVVNENIPMFFGTSGNIIKDSGVGIASIPTILSLNTTIEIFSDAGTPTSFFISVVGTKVGKHVQLSMKRSTLAMIGVREFSAPAASLPLEWTPAFKAATIFAPLLSTGPNVYDGDIVGLFYVKSDGGFNIFREPDPGTGTWNNLSCGWDTITITYYTV